MFPVFVSGAARDSHLAARALRFDGVNGYLSWTPARPASDPRRWTRSFWFKRTRLNHYEVILGERAHHHGGIFIYAANYIGILRYYGRNNRTVMHTKRLFRDVSGWMHWHEEHDSTQADPRLRRRVWINGAEETSWSPDSRATWIPLNDEEMGFIAQDQIQTLGRAAVSRPYAGALTAEYTVFDGAVFGGPEGVTAEQNINGVWSPAGPSGRNFGANGFWLNFAKAHGDGHGPGTDISGNGNHWAAHNITAQDSVTDTPSARPAPQPRIEDVREVFQAVYAPAAQTESALAELRRGWTGCAEIFKSRSAAGQWRMRFSHDPAHEYRWGSASPASASTVRVARAALSGADMTSGYAFRTGARFGTAAGSVIHTAGAAVKVTHNLGHARGVILLFKRTGTNETLMHHPDCAPGQLMAFGRDRLQAEHSGVTAVTADSFSVGADMPSDTYDWLVMTEASGCFAAAAYVGTSSSNGPQADLGLSPAFLCIVPDRIYSPGTVTDAVRSPVNPVMQAVRLDSDGAEYSFSYVARDFLADGFKIRTGDGINNRRGFRHYVFAFGQPSAAGARAR